MTLVGRFKAGETQPDKTQHYAKSQAAGDTQHQMQLLQRHADKQQTDEGKNKN